MAEGYQDAVFYSTSARNKLIYADSTIYAALLSKKNDLISNAYLGKGIVYYFNYKQYKQALEEYLKAFSYSEKGTDYYLKNEILYHLGVVKCYLGYHESALAHFEDANQYFYSNLKEKSHPNIVFNNKKGYFNTLHRIIVCQRNLNNYKAIDSLIDTGIYYTQKDPEFRQEFGYFLKEKGIRDYKEKKYQNALTSLYKSLTLISTINDFAWTAVDYFFIGKCYLKLGDSQKAIIYFQKVDSIFQKYKFILPELRENYELLIQHYKNENNDREELYYTKQILIADRTISKDFVYLSSKIHKEYDTKTLQLQLEKTTSRGKWITIPLILLALFQIILIIIKNRNEKRIKTNYRILEQKILNNICSPTREPAIITNPAEERQELSENLVNSILEKLEKFEKKNGFIEQGLTINKLAQKLNTNSNYLSQIINDNKSVNFNRYLSELRINYITNKLYNDKIYLSYKIETLAEACGIASRTNFSNLFREINGIRPTDFIKKRLKDLKSSNNKSVKEIFRSNQISSDHLNLSEPD